MTDEAATGVAMPHSIEAEQSVLGGVLISDRILATLRMQEGLAADHFYRDRHRTIFGAMCALGDDGATVDVLTVTEHLRAAGKLDEAGGKAAIDELTGGVPGLGGVRRYAQIVIEHWTRREQISAAYEQLAAISDHDATRHAAALQRALVVVAGGVADGYLGPDALGAHMLSLMEEDAPTGLPLPVELPSLHGIVALRPGEMTVVAAWPSGGKSALILALAVAAGRNGHRTVIWANDDTARDLGARHVQRETGIPAAVILERRLTDSRLGRVVAEFGRIPFEVQPCESWTAAQVAAHIRQVRPGVAVLDHFHNLSQIGTTSDLDDSIKTLKTVALQTGCHLIVAAQCNRNRLNGVCKPPPVLADLRGSSMFEAAANTILLAHIDEEEIDDLERGRTGKAQQLDTGTLDVAKNKVTGKRAVIRVVVDRTRVQFVEAARSSEFAADEASSEPMGF